MRCVETIPQGYIPGMSVSGSGNYRAWTKEQVRFATLMTALVDAGMAPARAAEIVSYLVGGDAVVIGEVIKIETI